MCLETHFFNKPQVFKHLNRHWHSISLGGIGTKKKGAFFQGQDCYLRANLELHWFCLEKIQKSERYD